VLEAAKRGHTVYAGLRDLSTADGLTGPNIHPIRLDVVDAAQRQSAVAAILEKHGRIDALVNNAGVSLGGFLEDVDEDEIRKLFDVNVFAAWSLTKLVLPAMRAQRSGTIVMVSSASGRSAVPGLAAYAGSKFALEGISEGWRHELRPFGIRVVLVEPGPYKTDLLERNRVLARRATAADSPYAAYITKMDGAAQRVAKSAGDPQDVANKIVDVIEARSPSLRYPMGTSAKLRAILLRIAPFWVFERVFARMMG
jgi:NAD(P)-dependent dehydrogenase (short-subunit alcohol dehydrogenase family)